MRIQSKFFPTGVAPAFVFLAFFTACASIPDYKPIVDTSAVADVEKYEQDMGECELITNQVDYSKEEQVAGLLGAGVGGAAVVGATAAITAPALAAGAVLSPIVWPLLAIGMYTGSETNKKRTNEREQKLRALVWNRCLSERGYIVLTEGYDAS